MIVRNSSPDKTSRRKYIIILLLLSLAAFVSVLSFTSAIWAFSQFANLKMEELLYELRAPLEGTGNGMIGDYILLCLIPSILIAVLTYVIALLLKKHPHRKGILRAVFAVYLLLFLGTFAVFAKRVSLLSYIKGKMQQSAFIEKNYVDPAEVSISFPERKQNLIFLYLESMETTFADEENGGAFETNYIPELTELAHEFEDFSGGSHQLNGGYAMPGATWTMAGMYATTIGLPLDIPLDDNAMASQQSFFPNLTALGDILEEEDYRQILLLGSNAAFGGRKLYYTDHGNFEFRDLNYAHETGLLPEDYKEFWGYEDEKLFEYAKDALIELSSEGRPFNLSLLTVDTHMPSGYQCRLCPNTYPDDPYATSVVCSSKQVSDFVHWVLEQDFADNTTIVMTGDHPTMAKGFCDDVDSSYTRKTYTCIINPAATSQKPDLRRDFTTFDLFPTTLAALGAEIPGDRLGLGTNLFSDKQTLSEKYGFEHEASELKKQSKFLNEIEKLDEDTQTALEAFAHIDPPGIAVDKENKTIGFETPVLSDIDYEINECRAKVWYYEDQAYVHKWQKLELQDNGSYFGVMKASKFMDARVVNYQLYVKVPDIGTISLGKEGTITINED